LAIDLILMIKHPFARKEDRIPLYFWASFAVALALTVANIAGTGLENKFVNNGDLEIALEVLPP